nr:hypothetical protein PJ912_20890 [Pectobacterium colocasium]
MAYVFPTPAQAPEKDLQLAARWRTDLSQQAIGIGRRSSPSIMFYPLLARPEQSSGRR